MEKLRYWCQKVLPLVYDDSLSYYELICKVVSKLNEVIESQNKITGEWDDFLKNFQNNLFDIVSKIIKEMYESGAFNTISNLKLFDLKAVKTGQQGDCFLINYDSKVIMIDAGYQDDDLPIKEALNSYGSHVDYLIISHFDPDHIGGIINNYYNNYFDSNTIAFIGIHEQTGVDWYNKNITKVIDILTQLGVKIIYATEGQIYNIGVNTFFKFNNTLMKPAYDVSSETGLNDLSLFTTFNCGNKSVLFCGDSNKASQQVIYPLLEKVNVLAIPHHGAYYSIFQPFLETLIPEIAIACDDYGVDGTSRGRKTAGSKRQLLDANATVYTTVSSERTFEVSFFVGNILTDGKAWLPNDILNANMINDTALTTITTELTDEQVFNSLIQYQRMFMSSANTAFADGNRILINDRVNSIFGYRGNTSHTIFHVNTLYDNFDVMSYFKNNEQHLKSFAYAHVYYKIVNGVISSVYTRTMSDLIIVNDDNTFKIESVRPMLLYLSNVENIAINNGCSILDSSNISQARIIRKANEENSGALNILMGNFDETYHIDNMTKSSFTVHIIIL